jgi:hypothetical protein
VYDDDAWDIKGKFEVAMEEDEEICWMDIGKDQVLRLWLVSPYNLDSDLC